MKRIAFILAGLNAIAVIVGVLYGFHPATIAINSAATIITASAAWRYRND